MAASKPSKAFSRVCRFGAPVRSQITLLAVVALILVALLALEAPQRAPETVAVALKQHSRVRSPPTSSSTSMAAATASRSSATTTASRSGEAGETAGGTWPDEPDAVLWQQPWVVPDVPSGGEGDDWWATMAGLQVLDSQAEPAHVMPEGDVVMGAVLMSKKQLDVYLEWRPKCLTRYLCPAPEGFERCSWCGGGQCLHGTLQTNGGIVRGSRVEIKPFEHANDAAAAFGRSHMRNRKVQMYPLIFSCKLAAPVPMHVAGVFTLAWPVNDSPIDLVLSNALTRRPPVAPEGSAAVCGRAGFGDVSGGSLVALSEYYRYHGFETVYSYQAGSMTWLDPVRLEMYRRQLALEDGKALRVIDLRNHLNRLYGGAHDFALLTSKSVGQMWVKFDCQLRARRDGHAWVLHTDLDEYVFPGIDLIKERDPATPLVGKMIELAGGMMGVSLGALNTDCDEDVHAGVAWPLERNASETRWRAFMRRVADKHVREEYPNAANVFARAGPNKAPYCDKDGHADDGKSSCNYHLVLRGSGTRKLFVRSTMEPQVIRVHETSRAVGGRMRNLDVDVLHHRHYRCVNVRSTPQRAMNAISSI